MLNTHSLIYIITHSFTNSSNQSINPSNNQDLCTEKKRNIVGKWITAGKQQFFLTTMLWKVYFPRDSKKINAIKFSLTTK